MIEWNTQAQTKPEDRTKLTNAVISRNAALAAYENAAAWLALMAWHQEQAMIAARMARGVMAWALAHPGESPELSVRELRRWVAMRAWQTLDGETRQGR